MSEKLVSRQCSPLCCFSRFPRTHLFLYISIPPKSQDLWQPSKDTRGDLKKKTKHKCCKKIRIGHTITLISSSTNPLSQATSKGFKALFNNNSIWTAFQSAARVIADLTSTLFHRVGATIFIRAPLISPLLEWKLIIFPLRTSIYESHFCLEKVEWLSPF